MNDKLAARMSMIEGAVGGPQASVAEIDNTVKRLIANDKKLTELNMNNNTAFAKMSKETRIQKHREVRTIYSGSRWRGGVRARVRAGLRAGEDGRGWMRTGAGEDG